MYQLDNHEDLALSVVVPYLLQFPELYGLSKNSGTRAQYIEDVVWGLLYNLDVDTAEGVWLDYLGKKVGQPRTYAPKVEGAFTFGGTSSQGFGSGKFISAALSGSSTKVARTDASFRDAIRAKIIENNTDCSLDELIQACKLLYQASIVQITEAYPAGISNIDMYGSTLLQSSSANLDVKRMLPAGVSLDTVTFYNLFNIFKNSAFIQYNNTITAGNDFVLSFSFIPDDIDIDTKYLFSKSNNFASTESSTSIGYNSLDGIVFTTTPDKYNNDFTGSTFYTNGAGEKYANSIGGLILLGGNINVGEVNTVKVTKVGTTYSLYVNNDVTPVETEVSDVVVSSYEDSKYFLGVNSNSFYNSGSIYNFYLYDSILNEIVINDTLKTGTIGINNGVKFI